MSSLDAVRNRILNETSTWQSQTLYEAFCDTVSKYPDHVFLITADETYTYQEARSYTSRLMKLMAKIGITSGSHIALWMDNCPEFVFFSLAAAGTGAVKIAVNTRLGDDELSYILKQSDAEWFFTDPSFSKEVKNLCPFLKGHIQLSFFDSTKDWQFHYEPFSVQEEGVHSNENKISSDSLAEIMYTSGSSGFPKGVMITHDMILRRAFASRLNRGVVAGYRSYIPLPLFHIFGYVAGMWTMILSGAAMVLPPAHDTAEKTLKLLQKSKADEFLGVPLLINHLVSCNSFTPGCLPDLKIVYCAAFSYGEVIWDIIQNQLGVKTLITGYGMTETCGAITETTPDENADTVRNRIGHLLPAGCTGEPAFGGKQAECKVVDPSTGQNAERGKPGELLCRGKIVTKGYYKREDETRLAYTDDGWFKTGDIVILHENDEFEFLGRVNTQYKVNGENVTPETVERLLGKSPLINQVQVVGIPHTKYGWIGVAFIELKEDNALNRQHIFQYGKTHLAKFQVPRHYVFLSGKEWPRTASGKVLKPELQKTALEMFGEEEALQNYKQKARKTI